MRTRSRTGGRSGFSLVEVAVALLVVSIGILATFGLFPTGVQSGKASLDETRAILFAEEAFNSFRALAVSTNRTWSTFINAVPAAYGTAAQRNRLWEDTTADATRLAPRITSSVRLNKYISSTDEDRFVVPSPNTGMEDYALRYLMVGRYLRATGIEGDADNSMRVGLSLWVWSGEFGAPAAGRNFNFSSPLSTEDKELLDKAFHFYTEIFNFRGPDADPNTGPEMP